MIENSFIIFSDEWGRHPSSCEHIVKQLLESNRILWVNTIGMRTPQLTVYDMKRSIEKIVSWFSFTKKKEYSLPENIKVLNPIMLPFNNISLIRKINTLSVKRTVSNAMLNWNISSPIVIASVTNVADYVTLFDAQAVVYYCVDEYVEWPGADRNLVIEMEEHLLAVSDLVLATADDLCQKKRRNGKLPVFIPHGVDFEHFNIKRQVSDSELLQNLKPPIIGFFGAVSEWLDFEMLIYAAKARPEWSFVLLGPIDTNVSILNGITNIHLPGKVSYKDLPLHAAAFDIGLIPFVVNELTISVNPLKLIEYLACGLPVVSSALPEVVKFSEFAYIANDKYSFVEAIELALKEDNELLRQSRKNIARTYSWRSIADRFAEHIELAIQNKQINT